MSEPIEIVDDVEAYEVGDDDFANSNQQLAQDEDEAIDQSNIIGQRTRRAKPQTSNQYNEGPNEDELPEEAQ
ncbi:uncharacterized protein N7469_007917 [Penicillium citrinum]|uniref:Histone chaperone domain-containing protein n=2 Tax=Penicillium TaxID=5073 RepID=A0A9W9NQU1_PENCI|nr:uncharacterized protein N7469_007917 [Penicillium citrinum]KAJ5224414.1 hypothetical protein N7469_007917 [Penicillium citrinum]KAJ5574666.1 hypothetical protein N7450_008565 [Penicillium hetheringtonii]